MEAQEDDMSNYDPYEYNWGEEPQGNGCFISCLIVTLSILLSVISLAKIVL